MKYGIFSTPSFYFGGLLLIISTILAVWKITLALPWKIVILILVMFIYSLNQVFQYRRVSSAIKEKLIRSVLKSIEQFNQLIPGHRLRSNIFFFNKKKRIYFIEQQWNMNGFDDKSIEIPENLGCTGEAWRTKNQVFGTKTRIFESGDFRIPLEQLRKVPKDLEWICSTPIFNDNREVIAVMNFDGNKELNQSQMEQIKDHCQKTSLELKEILTGF